MRQSSNGNGAQEQSKSNTSSRSHQARHKTSSGDARHTRLDRGGAAGGSLDVRQHVLTAPITSGEDLKSIATFIGSIKDERQRNNALRDLELRLKKYFTSSSSPRQRFETQVEPLLTSDEKNLFHHFQCPICFNLFKNPVIATDGYTYCRKCIKKWISTFPRTIPNSPMTGIRLGSCDVIPNIQCKTTLYHLISMFLQKYSSSPSLSL